MEKDNVYVLIGIGAIVGAILTKLKKIPLWLILMTSIAAGFVGFYAFERTLSDFILGGAAGAVAPYVFGTAVDALKTWIRRQGGSSNPSGGGDASGDPGLHRGQEDERSSPDSGRESS